MLLSDQQKLEKIKLLEEKKRLQEGLPHLYGFKNYRWTREFLESKNKICLLNAGNQLGKSTAQIRKVIHWATSPELWPSLWLRPPRHFWYLMPSKDVITLEFHTKWIYLLPRNEFKNDPKYGWELEMDNKKVGAVHFNSGITLAFRSYAMDAANLQSATLDYLACDEEMPYELFDELMFRLVASDGYFSMAFTPTLSLPQWRETMELQGQPGERLPKAAKWQVSMEMCEFFEDGTKSHWTPERVAQIVSQCGSHNEVLRRVYGRFVGAEGLIYESFSAEHNMGPGGKIPRGWLVYGGIDPGSGGEKGHPAAIVFVAVHPEYTKGRVIRSWRGDHIVTTASDILLKYQEMKREILSLGLTWITTRYDWAAKDLFTIATRIGEPLQQAEKSHSIGENTMNALFKNRMIELDKDQPDNTKLAFELSSLRQDAPKTRAKDDLVDALRYAVATIAWNFSATFSPDGNPDTYVAPTPEKTETDHRREFTLNNQEKEEEFDSEFSFWNSSYES